MNWEAIGAIGEILGAAAVVITLFYLAMQLRQNSKQVEHSAIATEIAAYQDIIGRITDLNALRITNPEVGELLLRGESNPEELSEVDRRRYFTWIGSLLRHGDMAYFLYQREVINRDRVISAMGPLIASIRQGAGFLFVWGIMKERGVFDPAYIEFIDALVDEYEQSETV